MVAYSGPVTSPAASSRPGTAGGNRTLSRAKNRRSAGPLAKVSMILFMIGLVAIAADMILFASGSHDLPLWLNLTCILAPAGLGIGLIGVVLENRKSARAAARILSQN